MSKKMLFSALSLVLVLLLAQPVFAKDEGSAAKPFDIVAAKRALAEQIKDEYDPSLVGDKLKKHNQEVEMLLNKLAAGDGDPVEINKKLKKMKIHKLDIPQDETIVLMSQPANVNLNAVSIYANGMTGNWHVTGGGSWTSNTWTSDVGNPWFIDIPYVGAKKNVGNLDSVGITYYNTSGTYNTSVLSSQGYWHDNNGNNWYSNSPSHGDGTVGVAFDFQDKVRVTSVSLNGSYTMVYEGYGFASTITYDSNFANYNGKARTFYAHTYKDAVINSITYGASTGSFGVDIQISNNNEGWKAFNNSDTNF